MKMGRMKARVRHPSIQFFFLLSEKTTQDDLGINELII
jgi:hypothetical protein